MSKWQLAKNKVLVIKLEGEKGGKGGVHEIILHKITILILPSNKICKKKKNLLKK